jgi:pilus assembly protein CpaB
LSQRRGIIIAAVGILLALVGIIAVGSILRRAATPPELPTPIPPKTEFVVVTTHDLPIRSILRAEDLTILEVQLELAPPNALTDVEEAAGRITKIALVEGEMVMEHHLADPTNVNKDLAFIIEDEQVLMAFPASDLMSQINILQPGDLVDILASLNQPVLPGQVGGSDFATDEGRPEEELFTFNALQRVEISAVVIEILPSRRTGSASASASSTGELDAEATPQPTPTPEPSQIEPQAILVALDPQDALVLKHIKDAGGIVDIVLRAPTSTRFFELSPVMAEYLRDRYGLVISR